MIFVSRLAFFNFLINNSVHESCMFHTCHIVISLVISLSKHVPEESLIG